MKLSKGQQKAVKDLEKLLEQTRRGDFDDFSSKFTLPRTEFNERLHKIQGNNMHGKYDN